MTDQNNLPATHLVAKLCQGKADMAKRCREVAALLAKEGDVQSFEYGRSPRGRAWFKTKHIKAPEPTTRRRLYVWAHECAHVALGHSGGGPVHGQECEVEKWAHAALRRHGIVVPRKESERAREYVGLKIRRAERRGARAIDPEARRWSRKP
jgi:hypothetical protein